MDKKKRVLILTGGFGPKDFPFDKSIYEEIIAADSGYDLSKELNIKPSLILGDLDSTKYKDEIIEKGITPFPRDKDFSDTELAIKLVGERDYDLAGGGEGRLDHLLSILESFRKYKAPRFWFTREDIIISVKDEIKIKSKEELTLSILPINDKAIVNSNGLVWELKDFEISDKQSSLSNRAKEKECVIKTDKPIFLRISSSLINEIDEMIEK